MVQLNYTVITDWTASYDDPIQVGAGDPVTLDGQSDVWDGHKWLWAKNRDGQQGWIPDLLVSIEIPHCATEDYNAMELTCRSGQVLMGEKMMHGWVLCTNNTGQRGWVPARNLRINNT